MFKRIYIDNFRCFSKFEFAPARINLLLGANGSGKSAFLDVIARTSRLLSGVDLAELFTADSLTWWDQRDTQRIEYEVEGNDGSYLYQLNVRYQAQAEARIESEWLSRAGRVLYSFERGEGRLGARRPFVAQLEERRENSELLWFTGFLSRLSDARRLDCRLEDRLSLKAGSKTYDLDFAELSDGQRALASLYALLRDSGKPAGCLLLDEPVTHLDLTEIQPWLRELDERFEDSGQVFIASHHPEVIDYLAASDPWIFARPDGGPVRVRRAEFDLKLGLKASEQIARGYAIR